VSQTSGSDAASATGSCFTVDFTLLRLFRCAENS
jgi:hypothetical protein